jgi:hypothetical protein
MKLAPLIFIFLIATASLASGQAPESDEAPPVNAGLEVGTTGPGVSVSWRFADHFGVRGGFNYFRYEHDGEIEDVDYDATLRLMSEPLTFNYYPWKGSSFYISAGVLFNQNRLTGTGTGQGTIDLGGMTFPAAAVGTLNLEVKYQPVNPYISIGENVYFDEAKHWSLGVELGVFYQGNSEVDLTRTGGVSDPGIDAAVANERRQVEDYADKAKFWPIAKISLNFSF